MPSQGEREPLITVQAETVLPDAVTEDAIASLVRHILDTEAIDDEWHLGIQFVDDATMQAAHVEFMDIDEPTDIMTFPYEDDEEFAIGTPEEWDNRIAGGDLMISVDRAAENAEAAGWETSDELFFLVAHGMLHLLGWDDATEEDRRAMLEQQGELISSWREAPGAMP